jgi:hypothetical protein
MDAIKNKKESKKESKNKKESKKESNEKKKTVIQLKDILVFSEQKYIDIKEHFYYLALESQDESIYLNYVNKLHHQQKKETGTWDGFISLYENIKNQGFDFKNNDSIIVKNVNNQYCCLHGRHRICMMRHLYGDNALVTLKNDKVYKIKLPK